MKRLLFSTLVLLSHYISIAQTVPINDLTVPTSPGFVLIDKAPASIEKPTDPKTFGINILNIVNEQQGAIDFTPFWLWNHPNLSFKKYTNNKFPILQTINVSAAAAKSDTGSYVSAGIRTQIVRIFSSKQINKLDGLIVDALSVDPEDLPLDSLKALYDQLAKARANPKFSLEFAAAIAGFSQDNKYSTIGNNRYGAWLNLKYLPHVNIPLNVLGVFRYTRAISPSGKSNLDSTFLDYGLAASYQQDNFDLQFEYVKRNDVINHQSYHRLALVGNYMIAKNLVIVGSIGKNFSNEDNILAIFGAKFGLSRQKLTLKESN